MSFLYNSPIFSPNPLNISSITPKGDTFSQMKTYIFELEQNQNNQQMEINNLKNIISNLEQEKLFLTQENERKENTIKNLSTSNENLKLNSNQYQSRITELEKINASLNYNNIELTQKNKSLSLTNDSIMKSKNISSELLSIYDRLDEVEIIKSKLEFDNKNLVNQLNEIQKQYNNEVNMLNKLKNLEIQQLNKTILNLTNNLNSNIEKNRIEQQNINNSQIQNQNSHFIIEQVSGLENTINNLNEELFNLQKENKNLKNQINDYSNEIEHKNQLIQELKFKIDNSEEEYQQKINEFKINNEDNISYAKESQNQIEQLIYERDDLFNKYNELKNNYDQINLGLQETNNLFNEKTQSFNKVINAYNAKIREYKSKIQLLKTKIKELTDEKLDLEKKIDKINDNKEKNLHNKLKSALSIDYSNNELNNLNTYNNNIYQNKIRTSHSLNKNNNNTYNQNDINRNNLSPYYDNSPLNLNNENLSYKSYVNYTNYNINPLIQNSYMETDDPFSASQHKSLDLFRNILSKVDESLRNNKNYITLNQE